MEIECNNTLPFLDVLIIRRESSLITTVFKNPLTWDDIFTFSPITHNMQSKELFRVYTALTNCQERRGFVTKVQNVKHDLWLNGYPKHFVDTTINKSGKKNYPITQSKAVCTVVIPYVKGILEKFKCIGNKYNIKTLSKIKHTVRNIFVQTKPDIKSQQQIKNCIYGILCECGRRYIGELSRPLEVRLKEHKHNLKQGLPEK
jgi:hypothetical protein